MTFKLTYSTMFNPPEEMHTRFEAAVAAHPEILECYLIAGSADYMLRVVYADTADFERIHRGVVTRLPGVVRVQSTLALRTVKRTTALPI